MVSIGGAGGGGGHYKTYHSIKIICYQVQPLGGGNKWPSLYFEQQLCFIGRRLPDRSKWATMSVVESFIGAYGTFEMKTCAVFSLQVKWWTDSLPAPSSVMILMQCQNTVRDQQLGAILWQVIPFLWC